MLAILLQCYNLVAGVEQNGGKFAARSSFLPLAFTPVPSLFRPCPSPPCTGRAIILDKDILEAFDDTLPTPFKFRFPELRHYAPESTAPGGLAGTRVGFLFRTPSIRVWFNTSLAGRGTEYYAGQHLSSMAYCLQSLCGSNVTDEYQTDTTAQREELTWMGGTFWGNPQLLNTECSFRTECPSGTFATMRYHYELIGAPVTFQAAGAVASALSISANIAVRSEDNYLTVTMRNPVPPSLYLLDSLRAKMGEAAKRGLGMAVMFQCVNYGANCVYTNGTTMNIIPSQMPSVVPFFRLTPPSIGRYKGVAFKSEFCQWVFRCPSPTMYMLIVKSLADILPTTGNDELNMTAIDPNGDRVWDVLAGSGFINTSTPVFLNQGEGFLFTLAPRTSQEIYVNIDVRCYVSNCCNNLTQPVVLTTSSPTSMRQPVGQLSPLGFSETVCDGRARKQECRWRGDACPTTATNRMLKFPVLSFLKNDYPIWSDGTGLFRGRTPTTLLSAGPAEISYVVTLSQFLTVQQMFQPTDRIDVFCVKCNATAVGTVGAVNTFTELNLVTPHYCGQTFECPAGKHIRMEILDSAFITPLSNVTFEFNKQFMLGQLPFGTRVAYSNTNDPLAWNTAQFGYVSAPAASGGTHSAPLSVRFTCLDEACDVPLAARSVAFDSGFSMLPNVPNVANQFCEFDIRVDCKAKCTTALTAKLSKTWAASLFTLKQFNNTLTSTAMAPRIAMRPMTTGENGWYPSSVVSAVTSPVWVEKYVIRGQISTTVSGLIIDTGKKLPEVVVQASRSSFTITLPATHTETVTDSQSRSGRTPTRSASATASRSPTGTISRTTTGSKSPSLPQTRSYTVSISATLTHSASTSRSATWSRSASFSKSASASTTMSGTATFSSSASLTSSASLSPSTSFTQSTSTTISSTATMTNSESWSLSLSATETVSLSSTPTETIITTPSVVIEPNEANQQVIARSDAGERSRTFLFKPLGELFDTRRIRGGGPDRFDEIFARISIYESSTGPTGFMARSSNIWRKGAIRVWNRTACVFVLQSDPGYFSMRDDTVQFSFAPELFVLLHYNVTNPSMTLRKPFRGSLNEATKESTRAVASISALFSPVAGLQASRSMMLMNLEACEQDFGPLAFTSYPLGISLGDEETRYLTGAAVLNPATLALFFVCHLVIVGITAIASSRGWAWATQILRFPNAFFVPALYLAGDSITAAVAVTLHGHKSQWRILGAVMTVLWTLLPAGTAFLTLNRRLFAAVAVDESNLYAKESLEHFVKGRFEWQDDPKRPEAAGFCRRFSLLFNPYKPSRRWFLVIEMLTSFFIACVGAVMPDDGDCTGVSIALLTIYVLYLFTLIAFAPYITPLEMLVALLVGLFQTAGFAFSLMAASSPVKFGSLAPASSYLSIATTYLMFLLVALDVIDRVHNTYSKCSARKAARTVPQHGSNSNDNPLLKMLDETSSDDDASSSASSSVSL
jgi:hypothetical protein